MILLWLHIHNLHEEDISWLSSLNLERSLIEVALDEDLRKGLNNVPIEVIDIEEWSRRRHFQAEGTLQASARQIANLDDRRSREILGMFQKSIERFHKKYGGGGGIRTHGTGHPVRRFSRPLP